MSSRVIAEIFGKEHKNVLMRIKNLDCSEEFNRLNFKLVTYQDVKNECRPEYLITKDGFVFLVMGFTGKEAAIFKEKYIAAFNYMTEVLQSRNALKISYAPMVEAIRETHTDPKFYHYSNELDMINKIVLGMTAKAYKLKQGLSEDCNIREHIQLEQLKMIDKLQVANAGLLVVGMNYKERKEHLATIFLKCQNKNIKLIDNKVV